MDRQTNRVIDFIFKQLLFQSRGWEPNWERYKRWLKSREERQAKALVEANARAERKRQNDKVIRMYDLRPNKNKPRWED